MTYLGMSLSLILITAFFYAAAFACYALSFSGVYEKGQRPAIALMRVAFLAATFYLAAEAIDQGFFLPVANLSQALAFFSWSLSFVFLVLLVRVQNESFGLVLSPILLLLTAGSAVAKLHLPSEPTIALILKSPFFVLHIACAFFAYASFALSFAAGILYLIQARQLKTKNAGKFYQKLPSLEELERLIYQPLFWGVPLLLAAMAIGFFWSKSAFGKYSIFDPKTVATAITLLIYSVILYLRAISAFRGRQVAVLSLVAFGCVLLSFVGTRFIYSGHHYLQ